MVQRKPTQSVMHQTVKSDKRVTKQLLLGYEIDAIPLSNLKMIERKIYKVYMGKPES